MVSERNAQSGHLWPWIVGVMIASALVIYSREHAPTEAERRADEIEAARDRSRHDALVEAEAHELVRKRDEARRGR